MSRVQPIPRLPIRRLLRAHRSRSTERRPRCADATTRTKPEAAAANSHTKSPTPVNVPFIDRAHLGVWNAVWRSAMRMDRMVRQHGRRNPLPAGQRLDRARAALGQVRGLQPRLRFDVDVPLPHLNTRLHAFVGRVNRDEYVTERSPQSGAFAQQYGPVEEDETLFGIRYREPKQGGHFEADAGIRFRSPLGSVREGQLSLHARLVGENAVQLSRNRVLAEQREVRLHQPPGHRAGRQGHLAVALDRIGNDLPGDRRRAAVTPRSR